MNGDSTLRYERHIQANAQSWERLLQELVTIRSVFEHEHGMIARIVLEIERLGLPVERIAHDPKRLRDLPDAQPPFSSVEGRCSLVVRRPGTGAGRSIILNSHLDTVEEGALEAWSHSPFAGDIDRAGNTVYGRGALDDKAGVAISLAILRTLCELDVQLAGDVIFQYVLEDEVTGNGTLLCLSEGPVADAAVIIDGTRGDRAINEHAGNMQFQLAITGRPASVSVAHVGVNAAEVLSRVLVALIDSVRALNDDRPAAWRVFPSPFQLVIQSLDSHGTQLTVPEYAIATCYVTFPPPMTVAGMREHLEARTRQLSADSRLPVPPLFNWSGFSASPVKTSSDDLEEIVRSVAREVGIEENVTAGRSTGTSDLRHFAARGIPALLYGPGRGYNPHRPDECYQLDDLPKMVLLFLKLLERWAGAAPPRIGVPLALADDNDLPV